MSIKSYTCVGLLAVLLVSVGCPTRGVAASDNDVNELAAKILDREIELQKLEGQLHLEAANPSFNRARRTWLWDMGNALPTEGGLIAATALFYSHSNDEVVRDRLTGREKRMRNHIPGCKIAGTIDPQIVGQGIGGAGALFELAADYSHSRMLHKHKLNGRAVTQRVVALRNEIDALQSQYDAAASKNPNAQMYQAEGKVLRDIRDKCLSEFVRLESAGTQISVGRIIEDGVSFTRNSVGLVGNSINVAAVLKNKKRLNGEGTILNLIAASMIIARPFISNIGSIVAKKLSRDNARSNFSDLTPVENEQFQTDTVALKTIAADPQVFKRLKIYETQGQNFADQDALAQKEVKNSKQMILRRFRETVYGPTKGAQSVMGLVIGFRKQNNATADNRLAAAANTTYMSGQIFNIAELVRERVIDEQTHWKEKEAGTLPEQRISRNLLRLDEMNRELHFAH